MSTTRTYVVTFSTMKRWKTTVTAANKSDAIYEVEQLWDAGHGSNDGHPFQLIDDCTFDDAEARFVSRAEVSL